MQLVHYTPNDIGDFLSHTARRGSKAQGPTPLTERRITPDHARVIAETGESIGI